jgi:hypothetical protein
MSLLGAVTLRMIGSRASRAPSSRGSYPHEAATPSGPGDPMSAPAGHPPRTSGRPAGDGVVRKLILEPFRQSRAQALEAIRSRLESAKYVQDVLELLARRRRAWR